MSTIDIIDDSADAFNWARKTTIIDDLGNVVGRTILLDSGLERVETEFVDGLSTQITTNDLSDIRNYVSITETYFKAIIPEDFGDYEAGDIFSQTLTRTTTFDDGIVRFEQYSGESVQQRTETDSSDTADWATITQNYNYDGSLADEMIAYDDGASSFTEYHDGTRIVKFAYTVKAGDDDVSTVRSSTLDASGQLATQTVFDINKKGGASVFKTYVDGKIVRVVEDDTGLNGNNYTVRITEFEEGVKTLQATQYDDGIVLTKSYVGGQLKHIEKEDQSDAASWTTIITAYDVDGIIDGQETTFDNGTKKTKTYDDVGVLQQVDTLNADGSTVVDYYDAGVRVAKLSLAAEDATTGWSRVEVIYDENGRIAERSSTAFDGTHRTEHFFEGEPVSILDEDLEDTQSWDMREKFFDDTGALTAYRTDYDNDDVFIFDYVNDLKIQRDGDGDRSWEFKITDVSDPGALETTTYSSVEDLPDEIALNFFTQDAAFDLL